MSERSFHTTERAVSKASASGLTSALNEWLNSHPQKGPDVGQRAAQNSVDKLFGSPAIEHPRETVLLKGHISNVPEISTGIRNIEDLAAFSKGMGTGLRELEERAATFLRHPSIAIRAVSRLVQDCSQTLRYYAENPTELPLDLFSGIKQIPATLEDSLGYPISPQESGRRTTLASPWFVLGLKSPLAKEKVEFMGLGKFSDSRLARMGIRRVENYAKQKLPKEELYLSDHVVTLEATQSMNDGILTINLERIGTNGMANGFEVLNRMKDLAAKEGAHTLKVEGVLVNQEWRDSKALGRLGEVSQNGRKTVLTVDLLR